MKCGVGPVSTRMSPDKSLPPTRPEKFENDQTSPSWRSRPLSLYGGVEGKTSRRRRIQIREVVALKIKRYILTFECQRLDQISGDAGLESSQPPEVDL